MTEPPNAVSRWRGSSSGRCTSAGPKPICEKMVENPVTTRAALTTPNSVGDSNRAIAAKMRNCRTTRAALPHAVQTMPVMVR